MDFTEVMRLLKNASPYELYRLKIAIENEMENPKHIRMVRQCFAVEDRISYFDHQTNSLINAVVLEKTQKML